MFTSFEKVFPEDAEEEDKKHIREYIKSFMDASYPSFEPEIVHAMEKDYFLPALKVLEYKDGGLYSPQKSILWKNHELKAKCLNGTFIILINTIEKQKPHTAPNEECDCGIYGSVNIDEIIDWSNEGSLYYSYSPVVKARTTKELKMCVIEPSVGAKVILCRKGWKASKAFISEIVGETISIDEASQLLSLAWKRKIDVGRLYENR